MPAGLTHTSVHFGFCKDDRINRGVLRQRERERLHRIGTRVEAHVCRRIVHPVRIGRWVHVIRPNLFGLQRKTSIWIDEEWIVRPVFAKLLVVKLVRDDVVEPAQKHGNVTHGTNGKPNISLSGLFRKIGVDDNRLYTTLAHISIRSRGIARTRSAGLRAPQHRTFHGRMPRVPHLTRIIALMTVVRTASHPLPCAIGRQIALAAACRNADRRTNSVLRNTLEHVAIRAAAARANHNGIRTILLCGKRHLLAGEVKCLIPRNGLPLVCPSLAHTLHGVMDMPRAIYQVELIEALRADSPLRKGAVFVALNFHGDTIFGVYPYRAAVITVMTTRMVFFSIRSRLGIFGICLLQRGLIMQANRCRNLGNAR